MFGFKLDVVSDKARRQEWERLWKQTWHMGPRQEELLEPGDYVTHEFGRESIFFVRGSDSEVRGFYNVCPHRGSPILPQHTACGHAKTLRCPYHRWQWNTQGQWLSAPNRQAFPQFVDGVPAEQLGLNQIHVDSWGGWIWFTLSAQPKETLQDFLDPLPARLAPFRIEEMTIVDYKTLEIGCNWKVLVEIFSESYHSYALHPQMLEWVDFADTRLEKVGKHRCWTGQLGVTSPEARVRGEMAPGLASYLRSHGGRQADYAGSLVDVRPAVQQHKRTKEQTTRFPYKHLTDSQLTDNLVVSLFPNVGLNVLAESLPLSRYRPHPQDPEKSYFDLITLIHLGHASRPPFTHRTVPYGSMPVKDLLEYPIGDHNTEQTLVQDLDHALRMQRSLSSEGFRGVLLDDDQDQGLAHFYTVLSHYLEQ